MKRPLAFVIEDQPSLSTLYEDALRLVGYDVIAVRDGLEALNKLELNEPPTFIILDINLPSLSGRDLHKHLRKHSRYDNTPVMILTANSVMANAIRPEITTNDHLFIKPMSMKALQDFAKAMRPGKDGVPDHMAKTQKIPNMPLLEDDEDEDTAEAIVEQLLVTDSSAVAETDDTRKTEEHQAVVSSEDEVIETETGEETTDIVDSKDASISGADNTESSEADEKASTTDAEAQTDSKSENP